MRQYKPYIANHAVEEKNDKTVRQTEITTTHPRILDSTGWYTSI